MPLDASIYNQLGNFPSVQDYLGQAAALKLQQGQVDELPMRQQLLKTQMQSADLANQQAQQRAAILAPIMARLAGQGSSGPSSAFTAGTNALGMGGAGPTLGAANAQANALGAPSQRSGVPFPLNFGEVTALKLGGLPDLTADYKMALEGVSHNPGSEVTDVNGNRRTIPTLDKGQALDANGNVYNLPGFVNSAAESAGATTGATERAKNSNTLAPMDRIDPQTGRPYNMTTAQLIDAVSPQPGSNLSGVPIGGRLAVAADAANRGVPLGATSVNGQPGPDFAATQKELDAAKSGGPEALARYQATHLSQILSIQDPQQRTQALQAFQGALASPVGTPIHPSVAPQGFGGFQGPAETAAAVDRAKAGVQLDTKPKIDYATDTAKSAADYKGKLDDTVSVAQDLQSRMAASKDALSQFTPGMGSETRLQIARAARAMGASDSLVNRINDGDIGAKQEFMKLSAQTAMESLKTALGGSGRITQAEFKVFQAANPNIELDPGAIDKIYKFATQQYQKTLAEQQGFSKYIDQGGDPSRWRSLYAAKADPNASGNIIIPGAKPTKANNDPLGIR